MTRDEKIAAAKEHVEIARSVVITMARRTDHIPERDVSALNRALRQLDKYEGELAEIEKPEKPRLMRAETRASLYRSEHPGELLMCVQDDRRDIAETSKALPRYWTRTPLGSDGLITEQTERGGECIMLADVLNLLDGR